MPRPQDNGYLPLSLKTNVVHVIVVELHIWIQTATPVCQTSRWCCSLHGPYVRTLSADCLGVKVKLQMKVSSAHMCTYLNIRAAVFVSMAVTKRLDVGVMVPCPKVHKSAPASSVHQEECGGFVPEVTLSQVFPDPGLQGVKGRRIFKAHNGTVRPCQSLAIPQSFSSE